MSAVDGAIFGLMALLIGFTFSGAVSRFDARRDSIVHEANAIGTAFLRIKLLPTENQPGMQEEFRRYIDARIAAYQKLPDLKAAKAELQRVDALQLELLSAWRETLWQEVRRTTGSTSYCSPQFSYDCSPRSGPVSADRHHSN
jgi:hypothetical protein